MDPMKDKAPAAPNIEIEVETKLSDAEASGKLKPLSDWLAGEGRDDLDAKELLKLAQKDERTRGKPPEEIAQMLTDDPALLDDLFEYRSGGMFAKMGEPKKDKPAEGPSETPGMMSDEMPNG